MIRLMLADDHAMFREGLRSKFQACEDVELLADASSGQELMDLLKTTAPDVLILDIKMQDANGITLIQRVRAACPGCHCVILTMYDHVRYALHALESGATAFVVKGSAFEELLQAVREASKGNTYISSSMAPKLAERFRRKKKDMSLDQLSPREFEVFTLLSTGMTVKEAAGQMGLSEKTVTTYRSRVMEKLELDGTADMIRVALESGLID